MLIIFASAWVVIPDEDIFTPGDSMWLAATIFFSWIYDNFTARNIYFILCYYRTYFILCVWMALFLAFCSLRESFLCCLPYRWDGSQPKQWCPWTIPIDHTLSLYWYMYLYIDWLVYRLLYRSLYTNSLFVIVNVIDRARLEISAVCITMLMPLPKLSTNRFKICDNIKSFW